MTMTDERSLVVQLEEQKNTLLDAMIAATTARAEARSEAGDLTKLTDEQLTALEAIQPDAGADES